MNSLKVHKQRMRRLLLVSLIFITVFAKRSFAQDSTSIHVFDKDLFLFEKMAKKSDLLNDSSFNHIQNYFSRNLMGNIGLPDYEYLLSYKENPIGVRWFNSPYDSKLFGITERNQYSGKGINTNIFGASGSKLEQVMKLSHVQNISDNFNVSLKLNRYGALGFYKFQKSVASNVYFTSNYTTKKRRFGVLLSYGFDRFKHEESGGITSDTSIVKDIFVDKFVIPVHLSSKAKRNFSLMTGSLRFFFKLNKDSLNKINHYVLFGGNGTINKSHYTDVRSAFYDTTFLDTVSTNDTTKYSKVSPDFSYNIMSKNINFEIGARYEFSEWYTSDSLQRYTSVIGFQRFAWQSNSGSFKIKEKLNYIASGSNVGDYNGSIEATYFTKFLNTRFNAKVNSELRSPDLFFQYTRVNNFYWKNSFEKSSTTNLLFDITSDKLKLSIGCVYRSIYKMIFLYDKPAPLQLNEGVNVTRFYLKHHLKIFKFHLENQINYQSAKNYVLPLPSLYTQHQLYFEHRVKKNGLRMQIGVQANYVGKMELMSYNPALNSFYLRNLQSPKVEGGNYVFADFFFNVSFKPVTLFFKAEHLNQGFTGMNYTLLNGYFQPDRAFRFGLNWEFWD